MVDFNKKSMKNLDKSSFEYYTKLTQKQLEKELLKLDIKSDFSYIGDGLYSYKLGNCNIIGSLDLFEQIDKKITTMIENYRLNDRLQ